LQTTPNEETFASRRLGVKKRLLRDGVKKLLSQDATFASGRNFLLRDGMEKRMLQDTTFASGYNVCFASTAWHEETFASRRCGETFASGYNFCIAPAWHGETFASRRRLGMKKLLLRVDGLA
jgi:hypothetical protein